MEDRALVRECSGPRSPTPLATQTVLPRRRKRTIRPSREMHNINSSKASTPPAGREARDKATRQSQVHCRRRPLGAKVNANQLPIPGQRPSAFYRKHAWTSTPSQPMITLSSPLPHKRLPLCCPRPRKSASLTRPAKKPGDPFILCLRA